MDDIRDETPASETSGPRPLGSASGGSPEKSPRSVGPESETRGGSEAPDSTLGDASTRSHTATHGGLSTMFSPPDGMPGMRADLPPGSLPGPYLGPQGDEDRTPPANAPSPVLPAITVPDRDPT